MSKYRISEQASASYCPKIWDAGDLYAAMRTHGQRPALRYIEGGKIKELTYEHSHTLVFVLNIL